MGLKNLINGQDIKFDTHQAGDKAEVNWRDLHMEKYIHDRRGSIKFDFFSSREPQNSGMHEKDFNRVQREVKKILRKDPEKLQKFADLAVSEIVRFSSGEASQDDVELAAKNIAGHFDLNSNFEKVVVNLYGNKISSFISIHRGKDKLFNLIFDQSGLIIQSHERQNIVQCFVNSDTQKIIDKYLSGTDINFEIIEGCFLKFDSDFKLKIAGYKLSDAQSQGHIEAKCENTGVMFRAYSVYEDELDSMMREAMDNYPECFV